MKKSILFSGTILLALTTSAYAELSAHQYHYTDTITASQCLKNAVRVLKDNNFTDINPYQNNKYGYQSVSGTNKDGYSIQYLYEARKGFAYMIVNGPRKDVRNEIRDTIGKEIKESHRKSE